MAARNFTAVSFTLNRDAVELTLKCKGAGAANPTGLTGLGIASVARTGAGRYTVTLSDKYAGLLYANPTVMSSTPTLFNVCAVAETVNGAKTVAFMTTNAAGTATDITATETLMICLKLSNSLQTPRGW